MFSKTIGVALSGMLVTSGLVLAFNLSSGSPTAVTSTQGSQVARMSDAPHGEHIHGTSLGFGMKVDGSLGFAKILRDPESGDLVRPVCVDVKVTHGLGLLNDLHALRLMRPESTEIVEYTTIGVSPELMDSSLAGVEGIPKGYRATFQPRSGFTWGTVRFTSDAEFLVYPIQ